VTTPTRDELRAQLIDARIAGDVATTRENNLANYRHMSDRDPHYLLGITPDGAWTPTDVLKLMVARCGVVPDPEHTSGQDTIDPDLTIERLDAMADRLRTAITRRERVLVATGHPVGMRPTHTAIATALRAAGCTLIRAADGWPHPDGTPYGRVGHIDYVDDVAMVRTSTGALQHTHSPLPMRAVLDALDHDRQARPDLVVADHGWAGAAGAAGVDAMGFADCNDPALFVAEAEGIVAVCVPLDDNVHPDLYGPMNAYLLGQLG
jgi:histidinol phosphate phosphatase hisN-like protein